MLLVGLTGGIASGKSTVSKWLSNDFKCSIVDADVIAFEVLLPGKTAYKGVVKEFGQTVVNADATINRSALADIVFQDEKKRKKLNAITHSEVGKVMLWKIIWNFLKGDRIVIVDVPLLIESKLWLKVLSHVVVVYCDEATQLERLMKRNDYTKDEALSRIKSQMPLTEKLKYATHVIDNSGSLESTKRHTANFYAVLKSSKSFNSFELLFIGLILAGGSIMLWKLFSW